MNHPEIAGRGVRAGRRRRARLSSAPGASPLSGRTVLITGAARGIGAETARQVSRRGARVALLGLEPDLLAELACELGAGAAHFTADVRDPEAVQHAVLEASSRLGGIDAAIANAGVATGGPFAESTAADFERTIDINLLGVARTIRAVLPHLLERRGHLTCVASLAAATAPPYLAAYAASKAGVEAMADSLRVELRPAGVTVGVAYFSWVDTDLVRTASVTEPGFQGLVRASRLPLISVEQAAAALVRGIERRSRRVIAPARIAPLIMLSRVLRPVIEFETRSVGAGLGDQSRSKTAR